MDRYTVGTIVRPHGVRGAIKIDPLTDDVARFKKLKEIFIENHKYTVIQSQVSNKEVYLTLDEIKDRNAAELLRGKTVEVDKKDAVELKEGRFFIVDVIGCKVFIEDKEIGVISDVLQYGAADVYVISANDGKEVMIPAIKKLLLKVDIENKQVLLDKQTFEEVATYEDWGTYSFSRDVRLA